MAAFVSKRIAEKIDALVRAVSDRTWYGDGYSAEKAILPLPYPSGIAMRHKRGMHEAAT